MHKYLYCYSIDKLNKIICYNYINRKNLHSHFHQIDAQNCQKNVEVKFY